MLETTLSVGRNMAGLDALLLGRKTYDIFASYWPHLLDGPDDGIAALFNRVPKYVVSRNADLALPWEGSTLIASDVASQISGLRGSWLPFRWPCIASSVANCGRVPRSQQVRRPLR